jgi:hypothetical protein
MDKIAITRQPSPGAQIGSDSYDGLFEIAHLTQADLFLPTLVKLASSDANDSQHLDLLFPLHCIADFVLEQLRPTDLNSEIFSVSRFNTAMDAWQAHLQHLALEQPSDARRFGRLARLLRERATLFRLAKMYSSALLQG